MNRRHVVFIINLLQDVNIVRPLAYLAAEQMDAAVGLLVSDRFHLRDKQGIWAAELDRIAEDLGAEMFVYADEYEAFQWLQSRHGALVAASESNLSAHHEVHNLFLSAPGGFVRITLQHGLECVGFLQNRAHDLAHGSAVRFGADIVGGWLPADRMRSMPSSERSKLFMTGPSLLLQRSPAQAEGPPAEGLICENLHSVRLKANSRFQTGFMDVFFDFCGRVADVGAQIALRPHPGGQYVVKNKVSLPSNVVLANRPMYDTDLSRYRYGVSAPSSVVIDMILAGIPTAVWRDGGGLMDVSNYEGLTMISSLEDWLAFRRDALKRPEMILDRQRSYLLALGMPTDPADVRKRFLTLLEGASRRFPAASLVEAAL